MQEKIYKALPDFFQNLLVSLYDYLAYRKRHGGIYLESKKKFKEYEKMPLKRIRDLENERFLSFISKIRQDSPYFKVKLIGLRINSIDDITKIPFSDKEEIRLNIDQIIPDKSNTVKSNTGGTTGKSLAVYESLENIQESFGCLDNFRERFGWKSGYKTAWFSGKSILNKRDKKKNRYWKTDFIYNIRYYSTFHINKDTAKYYIDNFNDYQPLFFSGFPSSISELARIGLENGFKLNYKVKIIFVTSETLLEEDVSVMESFYGAKVVDQYGSSEGAPLITQCLNGHMHMEHLYGLFEVLDERDKPSNVGKLVVTSFMTEKTPLLRYRIGDNIELESETNCSLHSGQIVKRIHGRSIDYIFSKDTGKINLGNIANSVKYIDGIIKIQIIQDSLDILKVKIVKDIGYNSQQEKLFIKELQDRFGDKVKLELEYVDDIPREKSGKYRLVINNLKE